VDQITSDSSYLVRYLAGGQPV